MLTKGHGINTPGLRGHSVGDSYPYRVIAQGNPHDGPLAWRPANLITGETGGCSPSAREAHMDIPLFRSCCEHARRVRPYVRQILGGNDYPF